MIQPPEYVDGCLELYDIMNDEKSDFPQEYLKKRDMGKIWYRELSVFDRTRIEFDQDAKEITMKVRIPLYKEIGSKCACKIEGKIHQVYSATHVRDKNGFQETELTLIRPEREMSIDDQTGIE